MLASAGVHKASKTSDFVVIADIVKNRIERRRIAKIGLSHFLSLPNIPAKIYLFFVPDTSMAPN